MYCPNCRALCGENDHFCRYCGTQLTPSSPQESLYYHAPKRGSHWVPILILVILSAIGITVFFATSGTGTPVAEPQQPSLSETPWFTVQDGILFFDEELYTGSSELTVPETVDGETIRAIGDGCFEDCEALTTVILPDTVEVIGYRAFAGCPNIRGIFIPDSVHTIYIEAFLDCTNLEAVCIPASVTSIGRGTFEGCGQLFYIFYLGNHEDWVTLYDEIVTPYTGVFCADGSFYQGNFDN